MKYALALTCFLYADIAGARATAEMPEELQNSALLAAASLEEIAEQRAIGIDRAGAALLLWNYAACDIYNGLRESGDDLDMPENELQALQEKCIKVIHLETAIPEKYFQIAMAAKNADTSAISLSWAEPQTVIPGIRVLAIDINNSCIVITPGYGDFLEGRKKFTCKPSPWNWDIATTAAGKETP